MMSILRERTLQLCNFQYAQIRINIDITVKTVYGNQQGARKGHNTKHCDKQGLRSILRFIEETREYLMAKLRKGTTVTSEEAAKFITAIGDYLPGYIQYFLLRAVGEFLCRQSVEAAMQAGFEFIIANRRCTPPFESDKRHRPCKRKRIEYNSCTYQLGGWGKPCQFVAMRILKKLKRPANQP
jgi:hypothetical protein